MPGPLAKLASYQSSYFAAGDTVLTEPGSSTKSQKSATHAESRDFLYSSPCVLYECNGALEFTRISENISELLGLDSAELMGSRLLSDQRIPVEDLALLASKLEELDGPSKKISLMHRILDRRGLPLWVAHRFWKAGLDDTTVIQGCIVPMDYYGRLSGLEQAVISRFVHKMGNHFQLLNLLISSLKRTLPESKEISLLQETVEKAIEHTRGFSEYNQVSTCLSRLDLAEILQSTVVPWRCSFEKKGITFETEIHDSVGGAIIQVDPYLLDLAIGHVLQNALEATDPGGRVTLDARLNFPADRTSAGTISVIDSGCGMDENTLKSVITPFFTSKKNHEGLGLSMASRFIEIHGGILRLTSEPEKGTKVEIVLPVEVDGRPPNVL